MQSGTRTAAPPVYSSVIEQDGLPAGLFESLARAFPALVRITDTTGQCLWVNDAWREFTGTQASQAIGQGWAASVHPDDLGLVEAAYARHAERREAFEVQYRLRNAHGQPRWVIDRAAPRFEQGNRFAGFVSACNDVHERYTARQDVQQTRERLEGVIETLPQLVWTAQCGDGGYTYLNQHWAQYTGAPLERLMAHGWVDFVHPDDRAAARAAWDRAVADPLAYEHECRLRRHDGHYRWFKIRGLPRHARDGAITAWHGTCTEIEDLVAARVKAENASAAKSDFLLDMSHDIRTPMNSIIGLAHILARSTGLSDKQRQCVDTLRDAADGLLALINDMLDMAHIEKRDVELEPAPFNLVSLLDDIAETIGADARAKGLTFTSDTSAARDMTFMADAARLRQIIAGLGANALRLTERGEIVLSVEVSPVPADADTRMVAITIRDTAGGVTASRDAHIFAKRPGQAAGVDRHQCGASLAIGDTLAQAMGGVITQQIFDGQGSQFTLRVPLPLADEHSAASTLRLLPQPLKPGTRKRVLVVEDNQPNILVVSHFLNVFGYDHDVASSGREALAKIAAGNYAAVLMDVQMPGMDGYEATRQIRAAESANARRLPIIGMTANAMSGDREKCIACGMDDYIAKPFQPDDLQVKLAVKTAY